MEYWITDHGRTIYCDGDAGIDVPTHEMVVEEHAWHKLCDLIESNCQHEGAKQLFSSVAAQFEDAPVYEARFALNNEADAMHRAGQLTDDEVDSWSTLVMENTEGVTAELVHAATQNMAQGIDLREYAVENWDWIWFASNNATIHRLTGEACGRLLEGLHEIYPEKSESEIADIEIFLETMVPSSRCRVKASLLEFHEVIKDEYMIRRGQ